MKPISPLRFDALAGYARQPQTLYLAEEIGCYEHSNERILGLLIRDRADGDFGGIVFGRDKKLRFRCVAATPFHSRQRLAEVNLRREMERMAAEPDEEFHQGDEGGGPVDFFARTVDDTKLNPDFVKLRDEEVYSPARGIIEPMMRWYEDADGNFVEQFQTTGFDARIWELYLFAAFSEMSYQIDRIHAMPDFQCTCPIASFSVEATTVNPTRDAAGAVVEPPPTDTDDQIKAFLKDFMPIKYGSALTSKLAKKYWEKDHVKGKPLLFAIQDFSSHKSMIRTRSAFESYITGYAHDWVYAPNGELKITPRKIGSHQWGTKVIQSGFFSLPDTENISAVVFSNSGTISKFNRMGLLAGFGSGRVELIRQGTVVDHDPNAAAPKVFSKRVNDSNYYEDWCEGLDVWHNPNAKFPLNPGLMRNIAQHNLLPDGQLQASIPDWHPLASLTLHSLRDDL